jgi:hypothetical protein
MTMPMQSTTVTKCVPFSIAKESGFILKLN